MDSLAKQRRTTRRVHCQWFPHSRFERTLAQRSNIQECAPSPPCFMHALSEPCILPFSSHTPTTHNHAHHAQTHARPHAHLRSSRRAQRKGSSAAAQFGGKTVLCTPQVRMLTECRSLEAKYCLVHHLCPCPQPKLNPPDIICREESET